ncbi:MAG: GTP-binding protein [Acidimicrobiales bacterium]
MSVGIPAAKEAARWRTFAIISLSGPRAEPARHPGNRDFSEDTYRVLAAADVAIMVLDVAKSIEHQTLKLFEVCRARRMPVLTFLNKCDRPGREPLELLDEIERQIGLAPSPVTWPVGEPGDFRGVIDRCDGTFLQFSRAVHGATITIEDRIVPDETLARHSQARPGTARHGQARPGTARHGSGRWRTARSSTPSGPTSTSSHSLPGRPHRCSWGRPSPTSGYVNSSMP